MTIEYKHKFYIYHPDGKFTEAQIKELLDAAYKAGHDEGYNAGYAAGKASYTWTVTYPYTNNDKWYTTSTPITTSGTIMCNNTNPIDTKATDKLDNMLEFRYNGTEK